MTSLESEATATILSIYQVIVDGRVFSSIQIQGSSLCNGIYDPTIDVVHGPGIPIYKKRFDQNIILEYRPQIRQYQIKNEKYKKTDVCFAFTKAPPKNPEDILTCPWNVSSWEGTEETWSKVHLHVFLMRKSIQITGITGETFYQFNGIYDPSNIPSYKPIYQKQDSSHIYLRLNKHDWEIVDSSFHVYLKSGGFCSAKCFASTFPITSKYMTWYSRNGTGWTKQRTMAIDYVAHPVVSYTITGARVWADWSPFSSCLSKKQTDAVSSNNSIARMTSRSSIV